MGSSQDREQLERLLAQGDWLRGLARRLVRDPAAADDLVQETWLAALRSPPDAALPLRPWLAGVARRLALMRRRGEGRRAGREAHASRPEALPSTAELMASLDLQRSLSDLVVALDEPLRTTVLLRYHEGLSSAEIARRQGLPAGTVRWRLKRGLDQLRVELDDRFGGREAWLGSLAAFGRLELGRAAAGGAAAAGGLGLSAAVLLLGAALLALLVLGPGACAGGAPGRAPGLAVAPVDRAAPVTPPSASPSRQPLARAERHEAAPTAAAQGAERGAWRARFVDDDRRPLAGLRVVALPDAGPRRVLETDADGALELPEGATTWELFVAREGAFLARFAARRPAAGAPDAGAGTTTFVLARGATLAGRVVVDGRVPDGPLVLELDSDCHLWGGRELPAAVVEVLGNGRRTRATTDAQGCFRFHGLDAHWSGVLWAPPTHRVVGDASGAYGDESIYLTAARDGLVLALASRGTLVGRVVDEAGAPVGGAAVSVHAAGGGAPRALRSGADGVFRAALEGGREFVVEVVALPGAPPAHFRFVAPPPGGELGDLVVAVPEALRRVAATLALTLVGPGDVPLAGAFVRLEAEGQLFFAGAPPSDGTRPFALGPRPRAPTFATYLVPAEGGVVAAGLVPDGLVRCALEDAAGRVLARVEVAPSQGRATALTLRSDEPLRPLVVVARDEEGGTLVGGVVQLGHAGARGAYRRTGLDGRTVFPGLAAGTTVLDVELVKRGYVGARRLAVTAPPPDVPIDLVARRGIDLVLTVLDPDGAPVVDARVSVAGADTPSLPARHVEAGRYRADDAPPGSLEVLVRRGAEVHRVRLEAAQSGAHEVRLRPL